MGPLEIVIAAVMVIIGLAVVAGVVVLMGFGLRSLLQRDRLRS